MSNSVRPGNREKGWNDPPEFLHTENSDLLNQAATSAKKTLLNQRVAHTFDSRTPSVNAEGPVVEKVALTAPPTSIQKQETNAATTETPAQEVTAEKQEAGADAAAANLSVDKIEAILNSCVEQLKTKGMPGKVCDDILKRVKICVNNWPKLNDKVKVKMSSMAQGRFHFYINYFHQNVVCYAHSFLI
jgi:hypothetical protein